MAVVSGACAFIIVLALAMNKKLSAFFWCAVFSGALGGALYFIVENLTASAEYPAKYEELAPFIVVSTLFGVATYYLVRLINWLIRSTAA